MFCSTINEIDTMHECCSEIILVQRYSMLFRDRNKLDQNQDLVNELTEIII